MMTWMEYLPGTIIHPLVLGLTALIVILSVILYRARRSELKEAKAKRELMKKRLRV